MCFGWLMEKLGLKKNEEGGFGGYYSPYEEKHSPILEDRERVEIPRVEKREERKFHPPEMKRRPKPK